MGTMIGRRVFSLAETLWGKDVTSNKAREVFSVRCRTGLMSQEQSPRRISGQNSCRPHKDRHILGYVSPPCGTFLIAEIIK